MRVRDHAGVTSRHFFHRLPISAGRRWMKELNAIPMQRSSSNNTGIPVATNVHPRAWPELCAPPCASRVADDHLDQDDRNGPWDQRHPYEVPDQAEAADRPHHPYDVRPGDFIIRVELRRLLIDRQCLLRPEMH